MTTDKSKIDQLIKTHNPFAGHIVVKPQQIWGKSYPDVPSINAHASNAVFDAINKINKGQLQTVGITITAEKGLATQVPTVLPTGNLNSLLRKPAPNTSKPMGDVRV